MFGSLDISTSGMVAHRQWTESIAANLANQNSVFNADGEYEPYRAKRVEFKTGDDRGNVGGVHVSEIVESKAPHRKIWDPASPYADPNGYREVPNISPEIEQMNMLIATRAYEANVRAAQATKTMMQETLSLLS